MILVKWDFNLEDIECNGVDNLGFIFIINFFIIFGVQYCFNINNGCGVVVLGFVGY